MVTMSNGLFEELIGSKLEYKTVDRVTYIDGNMYEATPVVVLYEYTKSDVIVPTHKDNIIPNYITATKQSWVMDEDVPVQLIRRTPRERAYTDIGTCEYSYVYTYKKLK